MKTKVIDITKQYDEALGESARLLQSGELVAIPTETVYGLAANAFDEAAVKKIYSADPRTIRLLFI